MQLSPRPDDGLRRIRAHPRSADRMERRQSQRSGAHRFFLHVLEIGDKGDPRAPKVELVDGVNLVGALIEGGTVALFATTEDVVTEGEVTIPDVETSSLLISGLKPHAKYELQMTGGRAHWRGGLFNGVPAGMFVGTANSSGVLFIPFPGQKDGRLRLRLLATN